MTDRMEATGPGGNHNMHCPWCVCVCVIKLFPILIILLKEVKLSTKQSLVLYSGFFLECIDLLIFHFIFFFLSNLYSISPIVYNI